MHKEFLVSFHKGLRRKGSPRIFEDGECSIAQDCYFDDVGNLYSRKFKRVVSNFNDTIKTIYPYGNKLMLSVSEGIIYDSDGKSLGTKAGSNKFSCVEYNNVLYMANQFSRKRYNGFVLDDIGNIGPSAAPTVSVVNQIISRCSVAWTASASVTGTVDEHDYVANPDSNVDITSVKFEIAAGFATGVIAYSDFTALDLSSYTHIGFWVKANANVNAGVLQLLLDDTSGCVSALETLDIPALNIGQWTWVVLELSNPSLLTAVISVGLNAASDPGVITVRLDEITAITEGELDGAYYYKYTYVDRNNKESPASPASTVVNPKDEQASITVIASSDSKVDHINIYRLGGTLADWYLAKENVANTTHSEVDNTGDADLDTLFDADNNDKPPGGLKYLVEHYERLIGARTGDYPNSVQFSVEYQPEYWGENLSQQYLISNKDDCTGILSWGRYVIFTKRNKIYVIEGSDPLTWHIRRSDSLVGNIAPWSLKFYSAPLFISWLGLYGFDGNKEVYLSDKVKDFFKEYKVYLPQCICEIYDNKCFITFPDQVLIYDFILKIFYTYKMSLSELKYSDFDNTLYAGDSSTYDLIRLEEDNNLNDTVSMQVKSKAYPLHDVPGNIGNLRNFIITADTKSQDMTLNVYIDEELKQALTINTASLERIRRSFNAALKGKFAEFELVYSGRQQIEIQQPIIINPKENV